MVVTFYSYKGGVGRSMALANVAELLTQRGYNVVVCDWDLEAPGLERFLAHDSHELDRLVAQPGIIDLVMEYKEELERPLTGAATATANGELPTGFAQLGECIVREPHTCAVRLERMADTLSGSLWFLSAGRRDGAWRMSYNRAVTEMNWSEFFEDWGGATYFEYFTKDLLQRAQIVLIDSRTGVTELGGICTHHLADLVLLLTASNEQNRDGSLRMVESLDRPEVKALHGGREVAVLPIASRIDTRGGGALAEKFVSAFGKQFAGLAAKWAPQGAGFLELSRIPYVGAYSFQERVVAREPDDPARAEPLAPYLAIVEAVIDYGVKHCGLLLTERASNKSVDAATSRLRARARALSESVPKGEFYLAWAPGDPERANRLCVGLRAAGLNLWCDAATNFYRPGEISSVARFTAIERSTGYLLLLPETPAHAWLQAEANAILARNASTEDYRAFVLGSVPQPSHSRELQRIPWIAVDAELGDDVFQRIIAEISVARPLVPEPVDETILERLGSPEEAENRFFLGREVPFKSLLEQVGKITQQGGGTLAVVGGWGSGKTGYLRGGLLPALRRGWIEMPGREWSVAYAWLEDAHEERVEKALSEMVILAGQLDASRDHAGILRWLTESGRPLALVIDNCEKLVWSERRGLFTLIEKVRAAVSNALFLVLSVREQEWDTLSRMLPTSWPRPEVWRTPPLDHSAMGRFFAAGAKLFGVAWELDALERAKSDASKFVTAPRALGLVLREALVRREGNRISLGSYARTGGVEAVIAADAGRYLLKLAGKEKEAAKTLLLRLAPVAVHAKREMLVQDFIEFSETQEEGLKMGAELLNRGILEVKTSKRVRLRTPLIARVEPLLGWLRGAADEVSATATLELATSEWEAAKRPWITSIRSEARARFAKVKPKLHREQAFISASHRGAVWRVLAGVVSAVAVISVTILSFRTVTDSDVRTLKGTVDELQSELRKAKAALTAASEERQKADKLVAEQAAALRSAQEKLATLTPDHSPTQREPR
jgi:CobQ/CobB/MinD/ParA nucleotide binding domain